MPTQTSAINPQGDLFRSEQRRRVQKDRTVTLDGVAFEVDTALVGDHVTPL